MIYSCISPKAEKHQLTDYVDPFIGTDGHGHTYPGSTLPFGMIQLSPDTRIEGWDGCSGYHFSDSILYGFSHTHLSGTGVGDYNDLLIMPFSFNASVDAPYTSFSSPFDKEKEIAKPGYYESFLTKDSIQARLTTTTRCGYHQYIFNNDNDRHILINLEHRDKLLDGNIKHTNNKYLSGYRISNAWAEEQHFYFYLAFTTEFDTIVYRTDSLERNVQAIVSFQKDIDTIDIKVAMSFVDEKGAKKNFDAEIDGLTFSDVLDQADSTWEDQLSKVLIEDNDLVRKQIFYTALYHSFLAPNMASDIDGRYRGTDLAIHSDTQNDQYTIFSLWDTFRGTHPLFTLLQRKRTQDFIQTFLKQYQQGGQLPVWELASNYTGCMIGYHSVSVIQDAFVKGIDSFDHALALEAMIQSAEKDHLGLETYKKRGFMTCDEEPESVSKNLEYAYDDWCIAEFARALGRDNIYTTYIKRAQAYKHLFDPNTLFLKGRIHGGWFAPFDPSEVNFNYTEANGWQYNFFIPHDITGHVELMGGEIIYDKMLDSFFQTKSNLAGRHQVDITGLYGQYAHGNEPSHHCAYLYNYIGRPWKTQQRVKYLLDSMYSNKPDGLSGNEDCGQMSSWYNLSALGMYAVLPGSDQYIIGTPIFDKACLQLENGRQFCIETNKSSKDAFYIQGVSLNGKAYPYSYLIHEDIMQGGTLVVELGTTPNKDWGSNVVHRPFSHIASNPILPSPVFSYSQPTFWDSIFVDISCAQPNVSIYYTTDGSIPNQQSELFKQGFWIDHDLSLRAIAIDTIRHTSSPVIEQKYLKVVNDKQISVLTKYANQYAAGGDRALIDQLRGGINFRTGSWQGYQDDVIVVIDLLKNNPVHSVSIGFLQDIKSWIWLPSQVDLMGSKDGENYQKITTLNHKEPLDRYGAFTTELNHTFRKGQKFRYIKVHAKNIDKCPPWHLGAGGKAWVFTDEIDIKFDPL